jgi:hydroxyacylglutathione hydrolase
MSNNVLIKQVLLGDLDNFSYIVGDKTSGEVVVVDLSAPMEDVLCRLKKDSLTLKGILLTHGHYDHVVEADQYDVPVYLSAHEASLYTPHARHLVRTKDGEVLSVGSVKIECLHTPGHTPGCQCFWVDGNLFTGDTLFIDAVGRTDFPGGDTRTLFESLKKIKRLSDATIVWPGHNYGAGRHETLGRLKEHNPFLMSDDVNDFINYLG